MKVLIVEDNSTKANRLALAVEAAEVDKENIFIVPDVIMARERLSTGRFDLLILDLQIPNRYGERTNRSGGADVVRWLIRGASTRFPAHIVVVTGFELDAETARVLSGHGIAVLHAAPSKEDWVAFITGLSRRIAAAANVGPPARQGPAPTVVLTAVDVEHEQAKRVFGVSGSGEVRAGVIWHRATVDCSSGKHPVILAQAVQMGMPAAAVLTMKSIQLWQPRMLVMVGICAGIRGEVELGDLVVADPCWDYGSGKLGKDGVLKPDPRSIELREPVRTLIHSGREKAPLGNWRDDWVAEKPNTIPRLHVRPAASGSAVVADHATAAVLQSQSRKVVGLDMENYGFYFAASNSGMSNPPAFCSVKAVVDFADPEKFDRYQAYGAHLSAQFAKWLIQRFTSDE